MSPAAAACDSAISAPAPPVEPGGEEPCEEGTDEVGDVLDAGELADGLLDEEPQADATATTAATVNEVRVREVIILTGSPCRPE